MRAVREPLRLAAPICALACLLATGCGDEADSGDQSPIEAYRGRFAHAKCDALEPCCAANDLPFDMANCVVGSAAFVQSGVDRALEADAVFDADAANACVEAVAELTTSCLATSDDPAASQACASVWTGMGAPGDPCEENLDCGANEAGRGACYVLSPDTGNDASGVCVIETSPAQIGDVCGAVDGPPPNELADCQASDLMCDVRTMTCQTPVPIGGACPGFLACEKTAYCDDSNICVEKREAGSACTGNAQCTSGLCVKDECTENGVGMPLPCAGVTAT